MKILYPLYALILFLNSSVVQMITLWNIITLYLFAYNHLSMYPSPLLNSRVCSSSRYHSPFCVAVIGQSPRWLASRTSAATPARSWSSVSTSWTRWLVNGCVCEIRTWQSPRSVSVRPGVLAPSISHKSSSYWWLVSSTWSYAATWWLALSRRVRSIPVAGWC